MKAVIILSAGHGTRMRSPTPKVLHTIAGKPMLQWVVDTVAKLEPAQIIIVTSPTLKLEGVAAQVDVVVQDVPRGTGDGLRIAVAKLSSQINQVLLVCGDTPLLDLADLKNLANAKADLTVAAMQINDLSKSYGRVEVDHQGYPVKIVETKHNERAKANPIANAGAYAFDAKMLQALLPMLKPNQESGQNSGQDTWELYATDLVALAVAQKYTTAMVMAPHENFFGINTIVELDQAEKIMQARCKAKLMLNGVRFILPETSYLNHDVEIGAGTVIEPNVYLGANVRIANNVKILSHSNLSDCVIYPKATVGPFAHLRGSVVVEEGAAIGNFVEIKNSTIGKGAKAKHLSYIGDATVDDNANIGAGAITCNYNGFEKFKTHIGKNAMVGVNTTLVAPVYVGDGAYIAAGSIITEDVAPDSLAITRTQQQEKTAWALNFRARYCKKLS